FGPINHKKVARIMKSMGLQGFSKRRRCITTRRKPGHRVMPDLVGRKFTANEPNRVYVGDITYLPCKGDKNMYLATVIDTSFTQTCRLCTRRPHAGLTGHRCFSSRTWCAWQS
ncbi:IS3 family transposase, partial [Corynebacterium macginleyi]|nr:IS3 family transposase [Corynebacterium macginleyi]